MDLNKGYPYGYFEDVSIKRLIEELNLSLEDMLLHKEPTEAMRRTHKTVIAELCYRLNTLLGD